MDEREGKDRLGDTLHKKQRADEEKFFAEQDRQRVARMRAQEAAGRAESAGTCPRCGKTLTLHRVRGVAIDECRDGHGVWLDAGELEHLGGSTMDERSSILRIVLTELGLLGKP
jgi:hypothetical protein